jgi:putative ABC transport system ATP-binding protein
MSAGGIRTRLQVRDLAKARGERGRRVRIEIPELDLTPGQFVAVVGANGSGKSTLLDILGLILSPDEAGELSLAGRSLLRLTPAQKVHVRRRHFSYVLQTGGLLEFLTIRQNIHFAARLKDRPRDEIEELARGLGIADVLDRRPGRVSGGQRQKAAIARALVQESDIVLADEPTASLDTPSARRLMEDFGRLTAEVGSSLIMVTHDRALVAGSADTLYGFRMVEERPGLLRSILEPLPPPAGGAV